MMGKEEKVIDFLLNQTAAVRIEAVCAACQVSRRSVYNYLEKLKKDPHYQVMTGKEGIVLRRDRAQGEQMQIPQGYARRRSYIFRKGLIAQQTLNFESLLSCFAISEATLHGDILQIRKEIRRFSVRLVSKNKDLFFTGTYQNLKKLTQYVIYTENGENSSLLSADTLAEVFPMIDVHFVREAITQGLQSNNLFMDEYSLTNLLLHVVISLNQELNGIVPDQAPIAYEQRKIVEQLCAPIEQRYSFTFSDSTKQQFSLILMTRVRKESETIRSSLKNEESLEIVDEIFQRLHENYNLDMKSSLLKNSFCLHIDSLISRLKNGIVIQNPLHNLIKSTSPITYDLAIYAANIVSLRTNYRLSENEIAYIALHLGTRLEEIRSARSRLKVIIVCPEYYIYNSNLKKLASIYNEDLYIQDVYTSFDDVIEVEEIDFCICTVLPTRNVGSLRLLRITPFLSKGDRELITETIAYVKKQKRTEKNKGAVASLFREGLFFHGIQFDTKEEAIHFLCERLQEEDCVSADFEEAIRYRENIAPTDFPLIAIPHPVDYSAHQTVISVSLLKRPLRWHRHNVSIIFMIAMNNNDFDVFEDIFSSLITTIDDGEKVNRLLASSDHADFVKQLVDMLYD